DIDRLANRLTRVIYDHHGSVVQIRNALVVFLPFLQDEHPHGLAGKNNRFERIRQFIDVEYFDSLQLRNLIQIEIVGDDFAFVDLGQFNQFQIDFAHTGKIVFYDLNLQRWNFLQALQNIQSTPSAIALKRVAGIRDQLQFA